MKKSIAILLVWLTICLSLNAQTDTGNINTLIKAANSIRIKNADSAIFLLNNAFEQSRENHYYDGAAKAKLDISLIHTDEGDFNQSIISAKEGLEYCQKAPNKLFLCQSYNSIGLAYNYQGVYSDAAKYFDTAIQVVQLYHIQPVPNIIVITYSNLAGIHNRYGQQEKALSYLKQGEMIARDMRYSELAYVLINKGCVYSDLHQLDSALSCFKEALSIGRRRGMRDVIIGSNINIGDLLVLQNKVKEGVPYLKEAVALGRRDNLPNFLIGASYSLGNAYMRLKQFDVSIAIMKPAIEQANLLGLRDNILEAHQTLADSYEGLLQFDKALGEQKILMQLKDSMMSVEKTKAVNEVEVKYRTAQKDKEIAVGNLQLAKQQKDLAEKNLWIGGIILMFLSGGLFGWVRYKHYRKLKAAQIRALVQEKEMKVVQSLINGEERERKRIGRELHDGVGGLLFAIKQNLKQAQKHNETLDEDESFRDAMCMLDEATGELRKTAHNLMPEVLLQAGLAEAINIYADRTAKSHLIGIDVQVYGEIPRMEPALELSVYRIVQELIHNAVKHAQASHILVQLNLIAGQFTIMVEDNGKGFNDAAASTGIGMQNIRERVQALQGEIEIDSIPNVGTTVRLEFNVRRLEEMGL